MIAPGANKEEQEILRKFGFKMETAYMEVPVLTDEEIKTIKISKDEPVLDDVDRLLKIIEKLVGRKL